MSRGKTVLQLALAVLLLGLIPATVGCGEDVEAILNDGISTIDRQPGAWQGAMEDLIARLAGTDNQPVLDKVRNMYSSCVGQAENATLCTSDFFGRRAKQGLEDILHSIHPDKYPAPTLEPGVCNTSPSENVDAKYTTMITYYGYDFYKFNDIHTFKGSIKYGDGTVADKDFGSVSITSNYQMSLQFQSYDFTNIDAKRGPTVVLRWGTDEVSGDTPQNQSALPLILPAVPKRDSRLWTVGAYAASGVYNVPFRQTYPVEAPWRIDFSMGDSGHPGISQVAIRGNKQANKSLRAYNYQAVNYKLAQVSGTVSGADWWGPGAIFERTYRVYLIQY